VRKMPATVDKGKGGGGKKKEQYQPAVESHLPGK